VNIEVVNTELDSERGGRVIDSVGWAATALCLLALLPRARTRGAIRLQWHYSAHIALAGTLARFTSSSRALFSYTRLGSTSSRSSTFRPTALW